MSAAGVTAKTRRTVIARDLGICQWSGVTVDMNDYSLQHRRARGMGGSKRADTNLPGNLVLVSGSATTGAHGDIESRRDDAVFRGFNVRQGVTPARVPLQDHRGFWWLLSDDGSKTCIPEGLAHEYLSLYGMTVGTVI